MKIGVTKRLGALASGQVTVLMSQKLMSLISQCSVTCCVQERSCTSWEQHILQLLCHPLDRAEVLAEALLRVVSTWQEAFHEDGAALHRNLAVECVLLLQHVLQYCSQCGMELKAVDSTEVRSLRVESALLTEFVYFWGCVDCQESIFPCTGARAEVSFQRSGLESHPAHVCSPLAAAERRSA